VVVFLSKLVDHRRQRFEIVVVVDVEEGAIGAEDVARRDAGRVVGTRKKASRPSNRRSLAYLSVLEYACRRPAL